MVTKAVFTQVSDACRLRIALSANSLSLSALTNTACSLTFDTVDRQLTAPIQTASNPLFHLLFYAFVPGSSLTFRHRASSV